jgi:hypothetical protein
MREKRGPASVRGKAGSGCYPFRVLAADGTPLLGSASQGVIRDDAGKALDPLQMRDRAVNIRQRLTTRMPSGEQPGDIRTRHAPKAGLVLLNNQI